KPPIEELDQFLEFQLSWQGPAYGDLLHLLDEEKRISVSSVQGKITGHKMGGSGGLVNVSKTD
nr:hypothetical protein [Tanacetum cinerariifolium]